MNRKSTIYLLMVCSSLIACIHRQPKTNQITAQCDSCCLTKLAKFADTLNFHKNLRYFGDYLNDKSFSLDSCKLKNLRSNYSLKSSLVLIWLKVDRVYIEKKWEVAYSQDIAGTSSAMRQVVSEFYFLAVGKDEKWIEFMDPGWVNDIVKKDTSLLKNSQIKKFYVENKLLAIKNKHHKKS